MSAGRPSRNRTSSPSFLSMSSSEQSEEDRPRASGGNKRRCSERLKNKPMTPQRPDSSPFKIPSPFASPSSSKASRFRREKSFSEDDSMSITSSVMEKNVLERLGVSLDANELRDIDDEADSDGGLPIEDLINLGLGSVKEENIKEEVEGRKLRQQLTKLNTHTPLGITKGARCKVLKKDVETVMITKEKIDALISVLEATRDKLTYQDSNLTFTQPPCRVKKTKMNINLSGS